jgi:hypothetical protein
MGKFNENDIKTDFEGYKFNHRMLYFECKRISRETGKTVENMKGEVEFIKYIEGSKTNKGWLMHNRTLIRRGTAINMRLFEYYIGFRYLKSKKSQGFISFNTFLSVLIVSSVCLF